MKTTQSGSALVVGLLLLSLISLLGLAGAGVAQVELQLARNEQFRENAASAASAGVEIAISQVTASDTPPTRLAASLPGTTDSYEVTIRLMGYEAGLPQVPGARLAGAHFEVVSSGQAGRGARDRQIAVVMRIVEVAEPAAVADCEPVAPGVACVNAGELQRLSWHRLPPD